VMGTLTKVKTTPFLIPLHSSPYIKGNFWRSRNTFVCVFSWTISITKKFVYYTSTTIRHQFTKNCGTNYLKIVVKRRFFFSFEGAGSVLLSSRTAYVFLAFYFRWIPFLSCCRFSESQNHWFLLESLRR
jgi:hypothetical protein